MEILNVKSSFMDISEVNILVSFGAYKTMGISSKFLICFLGPVLFNPQQPPPRMQPIRGQVRGAYTQLRATHGNDPTQGHDPNFEVKGQTEQAAAKNPFIPLQVISTEI